MTIVEFLEARIVEDEQQARKHLPALSSHGLGDYGLRILAECAAKRAIIANWEDPEGIGPFTGDVDAGLVMGIDAAVCALAAVYKDHPDYQQEWSV